MHSVKYAAHVQILVRDASIPSLLELQIHGLQQDCSNPIANALELLQYCTKPSKYLKTRSGCITLLPNYIYNVSLW